MGRSIAVLLALMLLALGLGPAAAQDATPEAESLLAGLGYPELLVATDGADVTVPTDVAAGRYRLVLENTGTLTSELLLVRVPDGSTAAEVQAALQEAEGSDVPPALIYELVLNGGVSVEPGSTGDVVLDLTAGEWLLNLVGFSEESDEGYDLYESITVTGDAPAATDPAAAVEVELQNFDFVIADTIPAGPQVWKIAGAGDQPHHMVVAAIPDGATEQQVVDLIGQFFGVAASPEAGATPALTFDDYVEVAFSSILSNGQVNWLEIDLAPGTYAAVCFIPSPDGTPHVMLGMVQVFTAE